MASPITTDTKEIRPIDPDSTSLLYVNLQDNLEPFTVVWADTQINKSEDCLKTQDNLQRIINCLKLFDDAQKCILFVENTSNDDIIFLIVSGELGNTILASLHALPQVAYVYAFCFESAIHEQWTKHYEKIRGVFTDKNLLFEQIKMDVKAQCSRWSFTTEHTFTNPSKSTFSRVPNLDSVICPTYRWYNVLLDIIVNMSHSEDALQEMIDECRAYYRNNPTKLQNIDFFADSYEPCMAICCYTLPNFLFDIINKALRTQNLVIIFKFRAFIADLYIQLQEHYRRYLLEDVIFNTTDDNRISMVFRGQYLTFQELEHLKNNIKSIMITNTFCSATLNEKVAHFFISDGQKPPPGQMAVIFQIIIDDLYYDYIPLNLHNIRPFAYIASQSQIKDEKEVLFAFGSAFQIKEVISPNEEKRWWTVILSLESFYAARCSPDMREIFRFRPSFTPLIEEFAKFCHYVTENREMLLSAEWYGFTRPHIESLLKSGYNAMTESFLHNEKYAKGIDAMQRLLMLQTRLSSSTDISLVSTYCKLVVIYEKNNQYNESIHTFKDKVLPLLMSRDPDGKDYMNAASKECLPNGISFQDVCTSLSNAYESIGTSSMALLWRKLRKHMKPLAGTLADQQRRSLVSYRIETSEQMTDNDKLELYEKYLHNTLNSYKSSDHPMKNSIDKDDAEIFTDLVWSICGLKGCLRLYCYDIPVLEYASNSADIVSLSIHNTTTLIIGNIPSPIIQQTIMPSAPLPFHSYYHRFFADDIVHTSNAFEYATRLIHFSNDILIKLDFQSKIEPNLGSDPLIHQHVLFLRYFIHIQCDDTKEFLMDKQQSNHLEALNRRILTDFHLLNHETFVPSLAGLAFVGSSINDTATENENGSPVENVASLLFKLQWHIGLIVAYFYACNTEEKNDIQIKLLNIERRLLRFWIYNIEKKIIQTSNIYDKILKNRFTDQLEIGSYLNHRPSTHDFQFKAKDTIQCSGLPSIFKDILKILYELQEDDRLLHNLFDKWKQKESVDHDSSLQFEEETRKNLSTIVSLQSLIKYLIDYRIKVINTDQNDEFDRFITWYHACPPLEHMYNTIQTTEIMYHKARDYVEKTFLSYKQQIN